MFPYLGSKTRIIRLYPPPAQGRVVEAFAGSARYSLHWCHDRDIWINDIDPTIVGIWKYIQAASRNDIQALPELRAGEDLRHHRQLLQVERDLLGFAAGYGLTRPGHIYRAWAERKRSARLMKNRILQYLESIRHWRITCLNYRDLPDIEATWYIDPPYQHAAARYRYDCVTGYDRLGEWCRSRTGRVIVCEARGADWLPFEAFSEQQASNGTFAEEMIWFRDNPVEDRRG